MKKIFYNLLLLINIYFLNSCTEPYALQTNAFEDALVIEATITNEFKNQEIKISRIYKLEENAPKFEKNAIVYIIDDLGNQYDFDETGDKYISHTVFQAQSNRTYELHIITSDGKSYVSTKEKLTTVSPITDVIPEVITKDGQKGVQITTKSSDPTNSSKYYRFEYEETYKIIAPKWTPMKAVVTGSKTFQLVLRDTEAKICYGNNKSNSLFLFNTNNQPLDIVNFPILFINNKDYKIANRYSILVKQYIHNFKSFTYFNTIKKLSTSESLFSQVQPGYLEGNIKSTSNPNEKIIGYFDVSSYSEKRIFFNFEDLFAGDSPPPYITNCDYTPSVYYNFCFDSLNPLCRGYTFLQLISNNKISYYRQQGDDIIAFDIRCGDCSSFSSNIKPSFWID